MYTPAAVNIFNSQHDKLKNAIDHQKVTSVQLNLDHSDVGGEHTLLVTRGQITRIERSRLIGKRKVTIHLSKRQVKANVQHQAGFLGMLAGLAAEALPSLLGGLATGLVSGAVKRAVDGDGLYIHKLGHCVKINPVQGNGLNLTPHKNLPGVHRDGLYLKCGSSIYNGEGLLSRTF